MKTFATKAVRRAFVLAAVFALFSITPAFAGDVIVTYLATGTTDSALLPAVDVSLRQQPYFCGFASRETVGSASSIVNIYKGTSASGVLLFSFSLTANESRSEGPWSIDQCVRINEGLFIDRAGTGSTVLSVYSRKS